MIDIYTGQVAFEDATEKIVGKFLDVWMVLKFDTIDVTSVKINLAPSMPTWLPNVEPDDPVRCLHWI